MENPRYRYVSSDSVLLKIEEKRQEEFDDGEPVPDEDAFSVRGAHADEEAYHGVLQDEPVLSAQEIKRDEPEDPKRSFHGMRKRVSLRSRQASR